jgi:hypothetical protein
MRKRGVGVWERVKKGCMSVLQHPSTPHTHAGIHFHAPQIVDLTQQHDKEAPTFVGVNAEFFSTISYVYYCTRWAIMRKEKHI